MSVENQDACPLQFGDSSEMGLIGCQDYDGDGYFDGIDAFVAEPTQWSDLTMMALEIIVQEVKEMLVLKFMVIQQQIDSAVLILTAMDIQTRMNSGH